MCVASNCNHSFLFWSGMCYVDKRRKKKISKQKKYIMEPTLSWSLWCFIKISVLPTGKKYVLKNSFVAMETCWVIWEKKRYRKVSDENEDFYNLINFLKFYSNPTLVKSLTKNEGRYDVSHILPIFSFHRPQEMQKNTVYC